MIEDVLKLLEHQQVQEFAALSNCTYIQTKPRGRGSTNNYSSYEVTLQRTPKTLTNGEIHDTIEILETYFSRLRQGKLHIKNNFNKPYSGYNWDKF